MSDLQIRPATAADVPDIVAMLADDPLGATREAPADLTPYYAAFEQLSADPCQLLVVAERDGSAVGTLQLTVLHGLSRRGATRVLVEAVRVARAARGGGLGTVLMRWAIDWSRAAGASVVQLTSDATREDAHRFYERLGFARTHYGFKLGL
jgi:GNAT superfamily N-acetyltransferase